MEPEEISFKEKRIRDITLIYYSIPEIRRAIFEFSKNRECVPRYFEGFGKRPDTFQYESDITEQVRKGATSFHSSEELWKDALEISTSLKENDLNELRTGWDLLLDIDSPYLEYSKIYAQLIIQTLEFYGIKNIGVKYSGNKGFHIIIPWKAFPEEIYGQKTKNMFPEWPKIICQYLASLVKPKLSEKLFETESLKDIAQKTGKTEKELTITECKKCNRSAEKIFLITWVCPYCKNEIVNQEGAFNSRKKSKCPECRKNLIEKTRIEIYYCAFCNINSKKNPENFEKTRDKTETLIDADLILVAPRHLFRMPYSVDYCEPICIKKNNKIEIIEIGKFVDNFFKNTEDLQITNISNSNYKTPSLNLNENKTRFNKIKEVIRHKIKGNLYSIKLESGREVKITSGHSIFILKGGKINVIKGNELKKGDYVVGIRKLSLDNKNKKQINISDELLNILEGGIKKNIFLSNFDCSIFDVVYKTLSIDEKKRRNAYNWKVYKILPLDVYERLLKTNSVCKKAFKNSEIKYCKHAGPGHNLFQDIRIDKSLMRLLGYYAAEGHCDSRGRVTLSFGAHEKELIEDSKKILRDLGLNPRIEKPHKTATQIVTQSTILKLIFESLFKCGKNAREKRVPSIVWEVNDELKIEFLNSYIKGDGHLEKRWSKIIISTVSKKLKEDLCFLLSSLGLGYSLSERVVTRYNKGKNPSYVIIIQGEGDVKRLGFKSFSKITKNSLVNRFPIKELNLEKLILHSRWKNQYIKNKIVRRSYNFIKKLNPSKDVLKLIEGDCAFLKVLKIKKIKPKQKYVYDLSIKDDENFVGGNCILLHNSLHEKTALSSIVIDKDKIKDFQITDAKPFKVKLKNFYPDTNEGEARELLLQALDWKEQKDKSKKSSDYKTLQQTQQDLNQQDNEFSKQKGEYKEIKIPNPKEEIYPPCIKLLLNGVKDDGRKRALFILINFFKSIGTDEIFLNEIIEKWNEKNYTPLKQGYIQSQLNWYKKTGTRMPPNCDKTNYNELNVCKPDELCRKIKNPVNYAVRKYLGKR